ncbi:MAG: carboxymuconolactone decarboxylase family protein [Cyanobacteria bacterium RUI128]|nr:carboxymuconolactone decarboxylase family protein [Cyanobacteria bacterium RUI128]
MKKFIILTIMLGFCIVRSANCEEVSHLTTKERNIALIASYTAKGDLIKLDYALNKALDNKLKIYEIKEILLQMYPYCGFPRCMNAMTTFMKVTDERSAKGGYDEYGSEPKELPKEANKYDIGNAVQTELCGGPVTGRLYEFEPALDTCLKEHLFADIFSRGVLSYEEREIATVSALASMNGVEPQLIAHIQIAKNLGIPKEKIDAIIELTTDTEFKNEIFARGNKNQAYAQVFKGQSYLNMLNNDDIQIANVTFEPGCRNNWHIHHKSGQILLIMQGKGYYQEWGQEPIELHPGMVVNIPPEVKHWHGAKKDSWFVHIAIEAPTKESSTEWLEPVSDEDYNRLP